MAIDQDMALGQKFLEESLRKYTPGIVDTIYPKYWGFEGMYHQADGTLHFGAREIITARKDFTGKAVRYGGRATTIPLANFGITLDSYGNMKCILGADWTWDELVSANYAAQNPNQPSLNIAKEYREALEKGLREFIHYKTVYGDPEFNFGGLLTSPYVEVIDVAASANPFTGTPGSTAADRYDWLLRETSNHLESTMLTGGECSILTSINVKTSLLSRFTDGSADGTPLKLATDKESGLVSEITHLNEFSGKAVRHPDMGNLSAINGVTLPGTPGGASTFDLMLFIDRSESSSIKREYHPIETLTPFTTDDGMTTRLIGLCATSEMMFTQPMYARLYILRKV